MSLALLLQVVAAGGASQSPPQVHTTVHPVRLVGRVVRATARDTVAVRGAMVILHRVTPDRQGPIDSVRSGVDGGFDFHFMADSGPVYLASARWSGIEYFAPPLTIARSTSEVRTTVTVSDTSSTAPIAMAARHIIVAAPTAATGMRDVLDLVVLANNGTLTRVAAGSTRPTWRMLLPPFAANIHLGDGEFSAAAVERHGDTLLLFAPVPPGQRDLSVEYDIAPNTTNFVIPVDASSPVTNVLVEERGVTVDGGLTKADSDIVDNGHRFARWSGTLAAGRALTLHFPAGIKVPAWVLPLMIGIFAVILVAIPLAAARRTRFHGVPTPRR